MYNYCRITCGICDIYVMQYYNDQNICMLLVARRRHFFEIYNRFDDKGNSIIASFGDRYLSLQRRRCIVCNDIFNFTLSSLHFRGDISLVIPPRFKKLGYAMLRLVYFHHVQKYTSEKQFIAFHYNSVIEKHINKGSFIDYIV